MTVANSYQAPLLQWALPSLNCLISHHPRTQLLLILEINNYKQTPQDANTHNRCRAGPPDTAHPASFLCLIYLFIYLLQYWSNLRAPQMVGLSSATGLYHTSILYLTFSFKHCFKALYFKA